MLDILFLGLSGVYAAFLFMVDRGAAAISKKTGLQPDPSTYQSISIIVAARNEEANLPRLLTSMALLDYPLDCYEVIIVNDHSTYGTGHILHHQQQLTNLRVIDHYQELPGLTGKKAAISLGIKDASNDLMAFTDADCVVPPAWLKEINRCATHETDYLLAYSVIKSHPQGSSMRLKNFERAVYYALAASGLHYRIPITSSACNMIYRKQLFESSGGFSGIGHLASGDDDLLLIKMMPKIRESAFNVSPAMQITSFEGRDKLKHYHTNIRRASKFKYHPWWIKALSLFIFAYFTCFYLQIFRLAFRSSGWLVSSALIIKTSAEVFLCQRQLSRLGRAYLGILYPLQILIFPAQFIYFALRGSLGKYRWK